MKLTLDVYAQIWTNDGLKIKEDILLWEKSGTTDKSLLVLKEELYQLVGTHNPHGFGIQFNYYSKILHVSIYLFVVKEEHANIEHIQDYFYDVSINPMEVVEEKELITIEHGQKQYVSFELLQGEDFNEIMNILEREQMKPKVHSIDIDLFEKGAGGLDLKVVLEITSDLANIGLSLIAIKNFLESKYNGGKTLRSESMDMEKLKKEVANMYEINNNDLKISSFKRIGNEVSVVIKSRYKTFEVICNEKMEIRDINLIKEQQTSI